MPVYATVADLPDDMADIPAPDMQILLASSLVTDATITAHYKTDAAGLPINPELRDLFKAATIAQLAYWQGLGVNPTLGAAGITGSRQAQSKSIGSASVTYESSDSLQADRKASLEYLGPVALGILGRLIHGPVYEYG